MRGKDYLFGLLMGWMGTFAYFQLPEMETGPSGLTALKFFMFAAAVVVTSAYAFDSEKKQ